MSLFGKKPNNAAAVNTTNLPLTGGRRRKAHRKGSRKVHRKGSRSAHRKTKKATHRARRVRHSRRR